MTVKMTASLPDRERNGLDAIADKLIGEPGEAHIGKRLITLLRRAYEQRTGKAVLPLELEDELRGVFGDDEQP